MKRFYIAALCLFAGVCHAGNFNDYKNHIAADRLLVIFNSGVTLAEQAQLIKQSGAVSKFYEIPNPALTICFTANREEAARYFQQLPQVKFVSFFISDGPHYAGVLNNFFIKLKDKNFEPLMSDRLKAAGLPAAIQDKYVPNLYYIKAIAKNQNTVEVCRYFDEQGWCQYAAPDYLLNPLVNSDQFFNRQWAISNTGTAIQYSGTPDADMDVDSAWTITTGDANIKVAVIDAGVDTLHPDLLANLLPGYDAISDSNKTDGYPTPNFANDGHGTCCAGIVAAVKDNTIGTAGIAPMCKIIPVHVFYYVDLGGTDPLPYSTAAAFADAIGWAWSTAGADILSNSWGLPDNLIAFLPGGMQPVDDAIAQAHSSGRNGKGVAMFFSSGNEEDSTGVIWPSKLPQTIAVTATNMCDKRKQPGDCSGENWGANYGTGTDFGAPGVKIATSDMRGTFGFSNNDYTYTFNGTSAACPNAAAIGALLLSVRSDLHAEDIRNIIAQTADKVGNYAYDSMYINGSWCKQLGYGRVNAYRALQYSFTYSDIKEEGAPFEVKVYPNPANSAWYLQITGADATVQLYDMAGKLLSETITANGTAAIDASLLATGVYFLKVKARSGEITRKVIVAR